MSENGLRTFALHNFDQDPATLAALNSDIERYSERLGIPFEPSKLDPETVARRYIQTCIDSDILPTFTINEAIEDRSDLKIIGTETSPLTDTKIVKFRQYYNKIPIYGSLLTVELDENHELLAINSSLGDPIHLDPIAKISPAEALKIIHKRKGYTNESLDIRPRLNCYFDRSINDWRLVYIIEDIPKNNTDEETQDGGDNGFSQLPEVVDCIIDAHTGEIVIELPRSQNLTFLDQGIDELGNIREIRYVSDEHGEKRLEDTVYNVQTYDFNFRNAKLYKQQLPGSYVRNPPDPWNPVAIGAHANTVEIAAFLRDILKRSGIDGNGAPFISTINCVYRNFGQPANKEWKNAAWIGTQMIFGQRIVDGNLRSYALAKDVVAHEVLHGLTDCTARLEYAGESGALNESYSDIFGIIVSNFNVTDIHQWDWRMGESLNETGIPLRDLSDPTRYNQPAHMNQYEHLPVDARSDWGGVHKNSGIHNKAAYNLLTAKGKRKKHIFDAQSAAKLFYLALTQHLSRTSTFSDSRRAIELVARTLFRKDPEIQNKLMAIAQAFDDVGII